MCGLVCVISKYTNGFTQKQKELFNTLLFVDLLRGDDSTGVFAIHNNGDLKLAKEVGNSVSFMKKQEYQNLINATISNGSALVGHNRKATKGTISDENAHPFLVDNRICLVHNGTLWGDHKKHADVDVDSHAIAHLLTQHTPEEVLNKIDGAYALIWHDFEKNQLNIIRNTQRPLYWVETDSEWIYCSELSMLKFAADRCEIKLKSAPKEQPEDVLTTFTLENKSWSVDSTKLKIYPVKTHHEYTDYSQRGCGWEFGGWPNNGYSEMEEALEKAREKYQRPIPGPSSSSTVDLYNLSQDDKDMLTKSTSLVSNQGFLKIAENYPWQSQEVCEAFESTYCNGINTKDGMWLYMSPVNDPDVIFRYRYNKENCSEERLLQYAINKTLFQAVVGPKSWIGVSGVVNEQGDALGIPLIHSPNVVLLPKQVQENRNVH